MDNPRDEAFSERDNRLFSEQTCRFANCGCSVLVAGSEPRSGREWLYSFTGASTETESVLLFGFFGQNDRSIRGSADRRDLGSESVYVITTDSPTESDVSTEPSEWMSHVSREIDAFENAICQTITRLDRRAESRTLGDLYVYIDSLRTLLRRYETQRVERFLEVLNQLATGTESVVLVNLPVAYDSSVVDHLKPYFDINIDLRTDDEAVIQQRWNLLLSGHQTDWFPLESAPRIVE